MARLAARVGAVDRPRERGLSARETPLLGGLAILAGVLAAGALFLPGDDQTRAILGAAALITAVGALDDAVDLPPVVKLLGQVGAALIVVALRREGHGDHAAVRRPHRLRQRRAAYSPSSASSA